MIRVRCFEKPSSVGLRSSIALEEREGGTDTETGNLTGKLQGMYNMFWSIYIIFGLEDKEHWCAQMRC